MVILGSGSGTTGGTTGGSGNTGGSTGGSTGGTTNKPSSGGTTNKPTTGNTNAGTGNTTAVSTNANLKELHLSVEGLTPSFNKNTTNYNIVVDNAVENINITAVPEDSNAKVSISGNTNLQVGLNKISIKVTAPDNKTTKTYTINATKTDNPDLANANLENLAIENVTLNPEFNANVLKYTAEIGSDVETLNILAVPQIEGATVNIQGKDNIQFGENIIIISVVARDGVTTKDYVINLYKRTMEEEQNEVGEVTLEPENLEDNETGNISIGSIVFIAIVLSGVGGVIFIIVKRFMKENGNK